MSDWEVYGWGLRLDSLDPNPMGLAFQECFERHRKYHDWSVKRCWSCHRCGFTVAIAALRDDELRRQCTATSIRDLMLRSKFAKYYT